MLHAVNKSRNDTSIQNFHYGSNENFMKYMSSVDTTGEKQVAKQYKVQTSPHQASVTHNNKLRPNGESRRRAVGAIVA